VQLTLAVLLVLLSATVQASAIIAFRTPTTVVLAADSLQSVTGDHDTPRLVCKIHPSGRWWLLFGGFFSTEAPLPVFDVMSATRAAVRTAHTLADVQTALTTDVAPGIRKALTDARGLPHFPTMFPPGSGSLIVVAGSDATDPTTLQVGVFTLLVGEPFQLTERWRTCPGMCPDGHLALGASMAAGPVLTRAKSVPRDAPSARQLIHAQIDATPTKVRGPIDVLEMSAAGARWVGRDPATRCGT
jgi:hypothetical protein